MKNSKIVLLITASVALVIVAVLLFANDIASVGLALIAMVVIILLYLMHCYFESKVEKQKYISGDAKYRAKQTLMSQPEADFLRVLESLVPQGKYKIIPQVCLSAVIDKLNASYRNELFRMVDYCIIDGITFQPLLLIELNDSSHKRQDRIMRDEKVQAITQSAKLPLCFFDFTTASDIKQVRATIKRYIRL